MPTMQPSSPYTGIRVLDCTQGVAGPTATMHLADLGADVLKVEPEGGDRLSADPGYVCWNRNKQLTNLDVGDHRDLAELRRLVSRANVVAFDWSGADLERLGLDATSLLAERPDLIHAWMPPYGTHGRWAHLPDEPGLLAAVSGVADFHRATEDRPVLPVVPILAYAHGALGAAGIAAALLSRRRAGGGRSVVVTGLHAVAAMQAAVTVTAPGISAPGMRKVGVASLANYAPYRCSDGQWLFLGALTDAFFLAALDAIDLMEVMVLPGVDGSFANILLPEISAAVMARMQARFAERDRVTWLEALDRAGVPVAPVASRREWFDSETVAANGLRVELEHSRLGPVALPGVPLRLSATPASVRHLPDDSHRLPSAEYWVDDLPENDGQDGKADESDGSLPLKGIRVLDAASFVAGTFGPSILAQYGASVIKVEPPAGDPYRAFSGSFAVINQGKRGISLDITAPGERKILDSLIGNSDVFVENLRPLSRQRLGLEPGSTRITNPAIVHCSMGAYGDGPLADKPGFDPLLQARSGLMDAQGGEDEPAMSSMLVHDIAGGTLAAIGILAALYNREVSGVGQHVATSLAHASVMVQAGELTSFAGRIPATVGSRDWPGPSPHRRLYRCSNGWICLWARSPEEVAATSRALELSAAGGVEPGLCARQIGDRLGSLAVTEALDRFTTSGVPAAKVLSRYDVFTDPWLLDNGLYHSIPDAEVGAYFGIRSVAEWPGSTESPMARSFSIGQDTAEVLAEAGIDRAGVAPRA